MSTTPKGPPPVDLKAGFTRKLRCPRCAAEFGTPKRWDLDCPECGHRWHEVSERSRSERLSLWFGDVADRFVMRLMLVLMVAMCVAFVAPLFYIFWRYSGFGPTGGLVAAVVIFLISMCLYVMWFNQREHHSSIHDRARAYYQRRAPRRRGN